MIDKLPIYSASFTPNGDEVCYPLAGRLPRPCLAGVVQVFLSGRRPFFYTFNLATAQTLRVPQLQGKPYEKSLEAMWMCPDAKHVVFSGHNGCLMLVDRKVSDESV